MPKKEHYILPFLLIVLIFLSGCATTPQSDQPKGLKDPEEVGTKELLLKWEATWNTHDVKGHLALWNDKAQIMYGRDRQIASKKEYLQILPERMKANPRIKVGDPDIRVSGNKAEVRVTLLIGNTQTATTFYFIKENGVWSITSWKY